MTFYESILTDMLYFLQMTLAVTLDALIGDPPWYPHPVRIIGRIIESSEKLTRAVFSNPFTAGLVTVCLVLLCSGVSVSALLFLSAAISPVLSSLVAIFIIYTGIAARDLFAHSLAVYRKLSGKDSLQEAREEVAKIVGRDTRELDRAGICRACIETVAENMVDGITAPLFWATVASGFSLLVSFSPIECSAIGILLYKSINTMDSMIGYKNEKYISFGRAAAKIDDFVNFIPARISGLCVIVAAFLLRLDYQNGAIIFARDRKKHASPNAGHTEAAVAGVLQLRLGGPHRYFGNMVEKPFIGDDLREPVAEDIKHTNSLILAASIVFFFLCFCFLAFFFDYP